MVRRIWCRRFVLAVMLFSLAVPVANAIWVFIGQRVLAVLAADRAFSNALTISSAVIGSIIAFVKFTADSGTPIVAQLAPDAPLATPSGWLASTGATGTGGVPTPGPTGSTPTILVMFNGNWYTSAGDACVAYLANFIAGNGNSWNYSGAHAGAVQGNGTTECLINSPSESNIVASYIAAPTVTCPSGQTVSGTSCYLSDPSAVRYPSDGVCQIRRVGNAYSFDQKDPDCDSPGGGVSINGGQVIVSGTDGSGAKIQTAGDGTTQITTYTPGPNSTVTTETVQTGAPQAGAGGSGGTQVPVTGKASGTGAGQGSLAGTGNVPFDTSGLNQEPTQQAVKTNLDAIKGFLDPAGHNFSGTCGSAPTCNGDAVQCAVARAAWGLNCEYTTTNTPSTLGTALTVGTDPIGSTLPNSLHPFSTVEVGSNIDTSDALGGGSCPDDQPISMFNGTTFVLPLSKLCTFFTVLGYLMVALSSISCARIVGVWG